MSPMMFFNIVFIPHDSIHCNLVDVRCYRADRGPQNPEDADLLCGSGTQYQERGLEVPNKKGDQVVRDTSQGLSNAIMAAP